MFRFHLRNRNMVMALCKAIPENPVHHGEIKIADLTEKFSISREHFLFLAADSFPGFVPFAGGVGITPGPRGTPRLFGLPGSRFQTALRRGEAKQSVERLLHF